MWFLPSWMQGWPEYTDLTGHQWRLDDENYWWLFNGHNMWQQAESVTATEVNGVRAPWKPDRAGCWRDYEDQKRLQEDRERLQEDQVRLWMCPGPGWQVPVTFASEAWDAAWRAVGTYHEQQITSAFSVPSHGLGSGGGGGSVSPSLDMCTERNPCPVHLHIGWPSKHTLPRVPLSGQNECNGENSCPARSHSASCAVTAALAGTISDALDAWHADHMAVQEPPGIPPDFAEIPLGEGCCAECHLDDTPLYEGNRCRYCWMLHNDPLVIQGAADTDLAAARQSHLDHAGRIQYVVSGWAFVSTLIAVMVLIAAMSR